MVIRKPFRFIDEEMPPQNQTKPVLGALPQPEAYAAARPQSTYSGVSIEDQAQVAALAALIVQKLNERGIR
jgi:hypothetical protein